MVLRNAVPKYDPARDDSVLYVSFRDLSAGSYVRDDEYRLQLQRIIEQQTGVHAELQFVMEEETTRQGLQPVTLEKAFENIHTEIEIEDDL